MTRYALTLAIIALLSGCSSGTSAKKETPAQVAADAIPAFVADSAYHAIERQLAFGPRFIIFPPFYITGQH
ncbi:MAG: hypothetical protein J6W69_06065 [Bacteroidales bacterium]|nr:hypothetical protein [Bacteroidales bacterium]